MPEPQKITSLADEAARRIAPALGDIPGVAVVLGTGWGGLAAPYPVRAEVGFADLGGMRQPCGPGHLGRIKVVQTEGGPVLVQEGRLHCYEGCSPLEVSFPLWVYAALGVEAIVLTAAAGGLNPAYTAGDLMIVADHIYLWGDDPLIGVGHQEGRDRFMPAADMYPEQWQEKVKMALPVTVESEKGTYAFNTGPSFETDAEAMLLRLVGADAVGMSLPIETIVARYLGLQVGAVCCISNAILPFRSSAEDPGSLIETVKGTVAGLEGFLDRLAATSDMIV